MRYQKCNSEILYVGRVIKLAPIQHRHFHPTGDPTPSKEDTNIIERLKECGNILGIKLIDHIIIDDNSYYSLK